MLMTSEVVTTKMKGKDVLDRQSLHVHDGMLCAFWLGHSFDIVAHVLKILRTSNINNFLSTHSQC